MVVHGLDPNIEEDCQDEDGEEVKEEMNLDMTTWIALAIQRDPTTPRQEREDIDGPVVVRALREPTPQEKERVRVMKRRSSPMHMGVNYA